MTTREREIIREIRPMLDRGCRGRLLRIYQNLTTLRRKLPKCKAECGNPLIAIKHGQITRKFCSCACFQRWKRNQSVKKLLAASIVCLCALSHSTDLFVYWTNGDNGTNATMTVVSYGLSPGVYIGSTNVSIALTNVTITGLVGNQRYYVSAYHSDSPGTNVSTWSNEANAKTKMNPPKNNSVQSP